MTTSKQVIIKGENLMDDKVAIRLASLSPAKRALFEARLEELNGSEKNLKITNEKVSNVNKIEKGTSAEKYGSLSNQYNKFNDSDTEFSLFFFSDDGSCSSLNKYELLLKCSKFADENKFTAVWTPERHYKRFGGLYPNPAILGSAIAMVTSNIKIRAGSVVVPLHHSQQVVEDWSVVDNLSNGRVGISFASGWNPDDFAVMPNEFEKRRETTLKRITEIRELWKGENFEYKTKNGDSIQLRVYPNPIQDNLPIWLTALSEGSFIEAGRIGANVLTGFMEQTVDECQNKIKLYRKSLSDNGYDPAKGKVTLMVHTFIGDDLDLVRETVRAPMVDYLNSFISAGVMKLKLDGRLDKELSHTKESDQRAVAEHAFERYFDSRALMGTLESCMKFVRKVENIGIDELACLIDFGLDDSLIINGLDKLNLLRQKSKHIFLKENN